MAKVDRIIDLLESRIARGDYALTAFPPETRLAEEIGVSRMTARRAVLQLVENGLLEKDISGRVAVTRELVPQRPMHIAYLTPMVNPAALRWRQATQAVAEAHGGHVRNVPFFHWDDPVILEAIDSFDGLFLAPPAETIPPNICEKLRNGRARVVITGADYSSLGLRSIDLVPTASVNTLLDHLAALGHHRIAVFNTQPVDVVINDRLEQWKHWLHENNCSGQCFNVPEPSYGEPLDRAYREAQIWLSNGEMNDTAVLCLTMPAAIGLMRAMFERGLVVGRSISVCSANDEGLGRYLCPAVTSIRMPDPTPFLRQSVDWMAGGPWEGPLFKRPENAELFIGESTGTPSPAMPNNPSRLQATSFIY